jgi:DNA-binding transcriptional LysR family regulator
MLDVLFALDRIACRGGIRKMEDIANHHAIGFEGAIAETPPGRWMLENCRTAKVVGRCNSVTSALIAVKSGVGIAPLPIQVGSEDGDLQLLLKLATVSMSHFLLTHPDLRRMPRIMAFFDYMTAQNSAVRRPLTGAK